MMQVYQANSDETTVVTNKFSLCGMDQHFSKKLVFMYCAETRSVRILIATNSHLLYGIPYDILVDMCEHAHVYFVISHISSLEHIWICGA